MRKRGSGEGSICYREKQGLWTAQIYVDGIRKYKYSKKQSVVREWLLAQRDALTDGVFVKDESVRFGDFFDVPARFYGVIEASNS